MTQVDYLIVGSGLTGATIARVLADAGREVLVLERRPHPGGNVFDSVHPSKIRIHTYGPHYFRCSSPRVWEFVRRFSEFYSYEPKVLARVNGHDQCWPPNETQLARYAGWEGRRSSSAPRNFEEACRQKMPGPVYEMFIRGYTARQWGVEPCQLDAELATRIRLNRDGESGLTPQCRHRVLPSQGYAHLVQNLLAGIPVLLGIDYLKRRAEFHARKTLVFTGSLDEFFDFDAGHLGYRGQRRVHEFSGEDGFRQPCAQLNYPQAGPLEPLRTIEWKHLLPSQQQYKIRGTVISSEYPFSPSNPDEFEYPVPTARNRQLHQKYRSRARATPNLLVCGRLGSYAYLDMDQAFSRALAIGRALTRRDGRCQMGTGQQHECSSVAA